MRIASLLQDDHRPNGPTTAAAAAAAYAAATAAAAGVSTTTDAQHPTAPSTSSANDDSNSNQDPAPADLIEGAYKGGRFRLVLRQQPQRARMCGFSDVKDRRLVDPPPVLQLVLIDQHGQQILQKPEELPNWICHVSLHSAFTNEDRNVIVKPVRRPDSATPVTTPLAPPPTAASFDDDPLGSAADRTQQLGTPPLALQESSQAVALLPAFGPPSLDRRGGSLRPWSAHSSSSPVTDIEGQDKNSLAGGASSFSSHHQQHQQQHQQHQQHRHRRGSSPQALPLYPPLSSNRRHLNQHEHYHYHQSHHHQQQQYHSLPQQQQPHLPFSFGRSSSQLAPSPAPPIAGAGTGAAPSSLASSSYHQHHQRPRHHDYRQNVPFNSSLTCSPPPLAPEQNHHRHTHPPQHQQPHHQPVVDTSRYIQTLVGATVASCDPLVDVDGRAGMYFVYNDLSVRPQGSYRLKFLLVHLNL
ncbi:hypothetical protein HDU87_000438 [Geranomyces variabilis]|uniref:Velvet domain-containing protein n=1 Tax=Geranomyces variabilis TaxID=109894 RepID=A0AAD5TNL2_9FUNG|nr:hypothetical protein HDU87_000438 [Geranomyces variabilis]